MRWLMTLANYLWHPLFIPLYGYALVTYMQPYRYDTSFVLVQAFVLFILLVATPLMLFPIMRQLRLIKSIHLRHVKERKWPLMIQCLLWVIVLKVLAQTSGVTPLYYFYLGGLGSSLLALIATMRGFKVSLHQIGITGLTLFAFGLSWQMGTSIIEILLVLTFALGWVASARLWSQAHHTRELWLGALLGVLPQVLLFCYWL